MLPGNRSIFPQLPTFSALILFSTILVAAPKDRITRPVDPSRVRSVPGRLHHLADHQFDRGAVDPATPMKDMMIMFKLTPDQQADLDGLLADQQNPSSAQFHKWLTPEDYGNRFGLSANDQSKVAAWLQSEGFGVSHLARSRNWIAFYGTAAQVEKSLHTSIHKFSPGGEAHYSNVSQPSVPEALADVVGGFMGLDNFPAKSQVIPAYDSSSGSHFLAPQDFATIYDVAPLHQTGYDGSGQNLAIVGQSDVQIADIRSFRTRYGLAANDPKMLLVSATDPGFVSKDQTEANLDLEWAGAIAPNATIWYLYGTNAFAAMVDAVELNVAPIISVSFLAYEIDYGTSYRWIAQQANAQGITMLAAAGDSGAAGYEYNAFASIGKSVGFPAALPEVTAVGGTEFVEGSGNYWAATNSTSFGSAQSYIPEAAWNESSASGIVATGGGASILYPKPLWQTGPGVPNDSARHVPDVAMSAALHDGYLIYSTGANVAVGGTSASTPSMAGIVALLNQYQVKNGYQKTPGLGNINPQLYRLAQSAPAIFHDVINGSNVVPCMQGSPDCDTGSYGYQAGPGYDMTTGLGSVDANALVTQWNTALNGVTVTLSADATHATVNDTIQLTATVLPGSGSGAPTGTVGFMSNGVLLGSAPLSNGSASVSVPLYKIGGTGSLSFYAAYSGDAAFSGGGASLRVTITTPANAAAVIVSGPNTVWPGEADAQGLGWQTVITLREIAGVPAMITGFTIDGQAQSLSEYFPQTSIPPHGSVALNVEYRNLTGFVTRTFAFSGVDADGNSWSRQLAVNYYPTEVGDDFSFLATPLTVTQNPNADPSCQWSLQLNVDDLFGFGPYSLNSFLVGQESFTGRVASIFGTPRVAPFGGLQGTLCFSGITPPANEQLYISRTDGAFNLLTISFAPAPANPAKLSGSPGGLTIAAAKGQPGQANLAVNLSDKTASWTASIFPANRTTSWLSASQLSGTGPAQITLTANGAGFEPGVYRATIVLQSPSAVPQYVNIPVMFVYGGAASGMAITAVANSFSYATKGAPGMLLSVFGSGLAPDPPQAASGPRYPYSTSGVSATVNGIAAPILYASSTLVNIQIPYEVGAGSAVVGINNNGQIAGAQFQMQAAAPGIWTDAQSNILPASTATAGGYATVFLTGAGEVSPARVSGLAESLSITSPSSLPAPILPVSVAIDGTPAFIQFVGLGPGKIGTTQINFVVPAGLSPGTHSVVVTIAGAASAPATLTVTAPTSTAN